MHPQRPLALASLLLVCAPAFARQSTERVSLGSAGAEANADCAFVSGISEDGRYVAFVSPASNLVAGDTNAVQDVFVRDRLTGATERVSVDSNGAQATAASGSSAMSLDGRYVAFVSRAANLVPGDLNGRDDVFVRDRASGATTRVSVDSAGLEGNDHSRSPSLSGDGRWVAFASRATNLVPNDANGAWDVFVHDRQSGATLLASVDSSGLQGDGDSLLPAISAGGGCLTFTSAATNLVPGDANGFLDVFVRDLRRDETVRVSVDASGHEAAFGAQKSYISGDGRFVAFESMSDDLVPNDTNQATDVFVFDRVDRRVERVAVDSSGAEASGISSSGALSADGRFATFTSLAANLVAGDSNGAQDAFVHDRATGATFLASVDSVGAQSNGASSAGAFADGGRRVVFTSYGSNLVPGDANGAQDVFVRDVGPLAPRPPTPFCTAGTTTHGCVASISASDNPSASFATACVIDVAGVEGEKFGLVFYGIDNACFLPLDWGATTSFMCVQAPLQRTPLQDSGGTADACDGALTLDWDDYQQGHPAALGQPWATGARVFVQAWFRDPPNPKTTSLSDAVELTYVP